MTQRSLASVGDSETPGQAVDEPSRIRARQVFLAGSLYGLLLTLYFVPYLAGGRVLAFRDLADYAIPQKLYSIWAFRLGEIPLWNPFSFFGFPHLAALQSQALYPGNLLLFLPFPLGFNLSLGLHYLVACLGVWILSRQLGHGVAGATIAGLSYGCSPYLLSLTDLNAFLFTSSWLPWLVVTAVGLGRRPTPAKFVVTGLVFSIAFLAGEPQTLVVGALFAALVSFWAAPRHLFSYGRLVVGWGISAILSLLLVAPVLLPFLELIGSSERAGAGMTAEEVYRYSLEPGDLPTVVLPGFNGDVVAGTMWAGRQTYVRRPYLGAAALCLALLGLASGRRRILLFALFGLAGFLLALGPDGFIYPALFDLGFRQSRFPVKFLVTACLAVAVLAGEGTEVWRARSRRWPGAVWYGSVVLLAGIALVALLAGGAPPTVAAGRHVLVVAGLLVAVSFWRWKSPASGLPVGALAVVTGLDLLVAGAPVLTTTEASRLLAPTPIIDGIREGVEGPASCQHPRVYNPPVTAKSLEYVYRSGGYGDTALDRKKSLLFGNTPLLHRVPAIRGGESVQIDWVSQFVSVLDRGPAAKGALDLSGAGLMIGLGERPGFEEVARAGEIGLFRNRQALPRAWLVGHVRVLGSKEERLSLLLDPGFEPRREAIVESSIDELGADCDAGSASVVSCGPNELVVAVSSPARCLLVLTDTWYPGWGATVRGVPAEVLRVDHAFRGVVVGPGEAKVRFAYRPYSFRTGLGLFAGGFVACFGLLVVGVISGRPRVGRAGYGGGRSTASDPGN